MSTAERPPRIVTPMLVEGHRLDQPEFHRRYEAMPSGTRAELIEGVVFMPSPGSREHGHSTKVIRALLAFYECRTSGVQALDDATTFLGVSSEIQPDVLIRILPECGGQTRDEGAYVGGAPELVVEVSKATRYVDLGPKRADYERAGVLEYVVRALDPNEVLRFVRREDRLVQATTDPDGLYRSTAFPGLWLDPTALLADDLNGLIATLERGLASPEHAAFVARLAEPRPPA